MWRGFEGTWDGNEVIHCPLKGRDGRVSSPLPGERGPSSVMKKHKTLPYLAEATTSCNCWNSSSDRAEPMLGMDMLALW